MNGPPRKEWWTKRQRGYGDGRHTPRNMFQWQNQRVILDEASSLFGALASKDIYLSRALQQLAASGNTTALGIWALPSEEREKFYLHARLSKYRTPFLDKLVAHALALRMGAGDGQSAD